MSKHTDLPWVLKKEVDGLHSGWMTWICNGDKGVAVCNNQTRRGTFNANQDESEANARIIVNAVNNYDRLREAFDHVLNAKCPEDYWDARALLQELDNLDDKGLIREEAFALLDNDIAEVVRHLEQVDEYHALDDARQTVLANMCFNLGFYGLMGFRKMWLALARHDYHEAAKQMLDSRWARQVGHRADELAQIMRTGQA